jgi:glycosyltransferase involved in cell wall biosynthesis
MPPLEALACGVRVVIPRGVGLLDELKDEDGIHRYKCGDVRDMARALEEAAFPDGKTDPFALRAVVSPYTVEAWTEDHRMGFAALCGGGS